MYLDGINQEPYIQGISAKVNNRRSQTCSSFSSSSISSSSSSLSSSSRSEFSSLAVTRIRCGGSSASRLELLGKPAVLCVPNYRRSTGTTPGCHTVHAFVIPSIIITTNIVSIIIIIIHIIIIMIVNINAL